MRLLGVVLLVVAAGCVNCGAPGGSATQTTPERFPTPRAARFVAAFNSGEPEVIDRFERKHPSRDRGIVVAAGATVARKRPARCADCCNCSSTASSRGST